MRALTTAVALRTILGIVFVPGLSVPSAGAQMTPGAEVGEVLIGRQVVEAKDIGDVEFEQLGMHSRITLGMWVKTDEAGSCRIAIDPYCPGATPGMLEIHTDSEIKITADMVRDLGGIYLKEGSLRLVVPKTVGCWLEILTDQVKVRLEGTWVEVGYDPLAGTWVAVMDGTVMVQRRESAGPAESENGTFDVRRIGPEVRVRAGQWVRIAPDRPIPAPLPLSVDEGLEIDRTGVFVSPTEPVAGGAVRPPELLCDLPRGVCDG